jgi:hypothetical protein
MPRLAAAVDSLGDVVGVIWLHTCAIPDVSHPCVECDAERIRSVMNHPNLPKKLWIGAESRSGVTVLSGSFEIFETESSALNWVTNGLKDGRLVWEWTPAIGCVLPLEYVPPVPAMFRPKDPTDLSLPSVVRYALDVID